MIQSQFSIIDEGKLMEDLVADGTIEADANYECAFDLLEDIID